jgi:cytochrome P450
VQYRALSAVTGAGLLTADGDAWRHRRRITQPAFRHGALDGVAAPAVAAAEALRATWDAAGPDTPVDADAATMRAMLAVVGRTLFAADLAPAADRVVGAVDAALHAVVHRSASPLALGPLRRLPAPSLRRLRRAVATLDAAAAGIVTGRRATLDSEDGADDVLALLLRAADAGALTAREVRDEIVTMVVAGHETVASSLTWTLHLLAGHPQAQRELHAELDAVLGGRAPAWADVPALRYTRAVVDEALRLFPPAWVITRRALADDVVAGVEVPAGTLAVLSPWLLHRRPARWPDPDRFDPARFLAAGADRQAAGPAAVDAGYLPFGAGPRLCIGRDLALVEAVLVVAALLRDREVARPPGGPEPRVDALVTLRPRGGLPLLLRRRP